MDNDNKTGKVIIAGAGPGDPGMLTLRAKKAIESADVLIYDYLANPEFLGYAPAAAEKIYVGKKGGDHTMKQPDINRLLVEKAREGHVVVRLKGGDPLIFGRGSEEAEHLRENGVPFEIVPGIPAAIGSAATAGIPLTDRRHTSTLAFVTGHEDPTKPGSSIKWEHLAKSAGTIVFYMGVKNLPDIAAKLVEYGRPAETPVGIIRWGTTPKQLVVRGTLENIARVAEENKISPPSLIVVGGVNELYEKLDWFHRRPLFGKTVVVTRSRKQASVLLSRLRELGADAIEMSTIDIRPPESWDETDRTIKNLESYGWIVFTSVNGVEHFMDRLQEQGGDARRLAGIKVAAIGPATAKALVTRGIIPDFQPREYVAESIARGLLEIESVKDVRFLMPRADIAREALPKILQENGAQVDTLPVYRTVPGDFDSDALKKRIEEGGIDAVTFTSSSTARNFVERLGKDFILENRDRFAAISIGPITSATLRELGIEPAVEASEYTIPGLTEKLVEYLDAEEPGD